MSGARMIAFGQALTTLSASLLPLPPAMPPSSEPPAPRLGRSPRVAR